MFNFLGDYLAAQGYSSSIAKDHNGFAGRFGAQLEAFASMQASGAYSAVDLSYNAFSGPLPPVLYDLKTNAHRIWGKLRQSGQTKAQKIAAFIVKEGMQLVDDDIFQTGKTC